MKKAKIKQKTTERIWKCSFLDWSGGSKRYPKVTEVTEIGVVRNGWFYRNDGRKLPIIAKGFNLIELVK